MLDGLGSGSPRTKDISREQAIAIAHSILDELKRLNATVDGVVKRLDEKYGKPQTKENGHGN